MDEKTQSALKVLLFKELQEDPAEPEVYKSKEDPSLVFHMGPWIHFNKVRYPYASLAPILTLRRPAEEWRRLLTA